MSFPNDRERCKGKEEKGQLVVLCVDCERRRQHNDDAIYPFGEPAVRWTLRYGRRCDKRIPPQAQTAVVLA